MKHLRSDYNAIQPWPTKRPHIAKQRGNTVEVPVDDPGWAGINARVQIDMGEILPIIPDDEPVFLLRASDKTAPDIVRQWARAQFALEDGDHYTAGAVLDFADEMEEYAAKHYDGGKAADTDPALLP